MNKDIAEASYNILKNRYGIEIAEEFIAKLNIYSQGQYKYWPKLTPGAQILLYNDFRRSLLKTVPNSTEVRSWLCEGNSLTAYINAFEENWAEQVIKTGILSKAVAA